MNITWSNCHFDEALPATAVLGGTDVDGATIYVGRAEHGGDLIAAKVIPSQRAAYVSHGGLEVAKENFEVLCEDNLRFEWIPCANFESFQVDMAVPTGQTNDGEMMYVGRARFNGSVTPGKIHASHKCLYLPFGGEEHCITQNFEYLKAAPKLIWHACSVDSALPEGAVSAGNDIDGSTIYLCRAEHNGDLVPGKFVPAKAMAYIPYDGVEIQKEWIEILCHGDGNISWKSSGFGDVPVNAMPGGRTSTDEILYIGRGKLNGQLTPGKVVPSHHVLYIPFDGTEIALSKYEILVQR